MVDRFFVNPGGIMALGLLSLFVGFLIFILFSPYFLFLGLEGMLLTSMFIIIWVLVYLSLLVGSIISYMFRSMPIRAARPRPRARVRVRRVTRKQKRRR